MTSNKVKLWRSASDSDLPSMSKSISKTTQKLSGGEGSKKVSFGSVYQKLIPHKNKPVYMRTIDKPKNVSIAQAFKDNCVSIGAADFKAILEVAQSAGYVFKEKKNGGQEIKSIAENWKKRTL